jgi:hypothetical protein
MRRGRATPVRGRPRRKERTRLAPGSSSAGALQRAALLRADDLVLETLEEELATASRAERLIGLVPDRRLAATGRVCSPQLLERRTPGTGRNQDLTESMSAEIAVKLSTNSHQRPPLETPQERCQGVPCSHYPKTAGLVPLIGTQNRRGRIACAWGASGGSPRARRTRSGGRPASPRPSDRSACG